MKHMNQASIHNRNASNIPKDLNELLRDFKKKKSNNNINISNLPNSKTKNIFENTKNQSSENKNKIMFVRKYNDIMSEINTEYIIVQPKSNEVLDNRRHLKNLSLNNFIKSHIDKESPIKNIKKEIFNTKIEDVDFDNFYMDSRNLNNIAKLSDTNKLINDLKKNELIDNKQSKSNGNNSDAFCNSLTKNNGYNFSHTRSYSFNNQISSKIKPNERLLIDNENETPKYNNLIFPNSIKNDLSKITNILNFTSFNKSLLNKNSINSKEELSESIRKNIINVNNLKNSSRKTFYSSLSKTSNSKINGNNFNECITSNYSHDSISPERKNLYKDNLTKIGNNKTSSNFFNYNTLLKHHNDTSDNTNVIENSILNNTKNNINKKDEKSNLLMEKMKSLNLNCVEEMSEKIHFKNAEKSMRKRDSYSLDISSNNISNFNSSRNLNFVKNEFKSIDLIQNPQKIEFNKFKNYNKINNLNLLNSDNIAHDLYSDEKRKENSKSPIFSKIDSLYSSKNPGFKAKKIRNNNMFVEKYANISKANELAQNNFNHNTSRYNSSTFSTIKNELENASSAKSKNNSNKEMVWDSNFKLKNKIESKNKALTFQLIKNEPCKYNKFNNFKHLRDEIDYSHFNLNKNNNNLLSKTTCNFNRLSTGNNNNNIELTFSKNVNSFINKTNIVNKIEATKRLKLNK